MQQLETQKVKTRVKHPRRGMTLIEIMVVITIIGMIMAAVVVAVIPQFQSAKLSRVRIDFQNLRSALTLYYAKQGRFPDANAGLGALVSSRVLPELPRDPWNNEYVYQWEKGEPRLVSYGNDGTAGGEGDDADLCSCDPPPPPGGP